MFILPEQQGTPRYLLSYLQTFGERAEQHQMKQPPQSSWHRGRLLEGSERNEEACRDSCLITSSLQTTSARRKCLNNPLCVYSAAYGTIPPLHPQEIGDFSGQIFHPVETDTMESASLKWDNLGFGLHNASEKQA